MLHRHNILKYVSKYIMGQRRKDREIFCTILQRKWCYISKLDYNLKQLLGGNVSHFKCKYQKEQLKLTFPLYSSA